MQAPSADEPPSAVVRKVKTTSDYFNTLAKDAREPKLIQAIIDEDIKAVDGSRIRLRLLDDVEIDECVVNGYVPVRHGKRLLVRTCQGKHQQHPCGRRACEGQSRAL